MLAWMNHYMVFNGYALANAGIGRDDCAWMDMGFWMDPRQPWTEILCNQLKALSPRHIGVWHMQDQPRKALAFAVISDQDRSLGVLHQPLVLFLRQKRH